MFHRSHFMKSWTHQPRTTLWLLWKFYELFLMQSKSFSSKRSYFWNTDTFIMEIFVITEKREHKYYSRFRLFSFEVYPSSETFLCIPYVYSTLLIRKHSEALLSHISLQITSSQSVLEASREGKHKMPNTQWSGRHLQKGSGPPWRRETLPNGGVHPKRIHHSDEYEWSLSGLSRSL